MLSPLPSKSTSENWGRADTLCLSIHGRFVPETDITHNGQNVPPSAKKTRPMAVAYQGVRGPERCPSYG
jgi:hypothetical protein